ncbi:SRPBCC family protein [Fictibacillus phosphorivorans]|uniref:SRPBCC family protein n=1 Tax=Fictibacillus phosphorivorans TaxID=1221500 RepID=UPI00203AA583|nr:SRPBCC family protein [Fictibacillus phosphorivorans]MCM3720243.1 SRPBCC family protein [Fictibacillus phosphorivorans]MCM3777912.1 SRPBCC family protein [Fictibacillus phosphorivorans]
MESKFVYVTYIGASPEQVWEALTEGDITEKYFFGTRIESNWEEGSSVTYSRNGEVTDEGSVLNYDPSHELSFTWTNKSDDTPRESPTVVTFKLQHMDSTVKLTLIHDNLVKSDIVEKEGTFEGFNNGWPAILSNMKTYLETGKTLPALS